MFLLSLNWLHNLPERETFESFSWLIAWVYPSLKVAEFLVANCFQATCLIKTARKLQFKLSWNNFPQAHFCFFSVLSFTVAVFNQLIMLWIFLNCFDTFAVCSEETQTFPYFLSLFTLFVFSAATSLLWLYPQRSSQQQQSKPSKLVEKWNLNEQNFIHAAWFYLILFYVWIFTSLQPAKKACNDSLNTHTHVYTEVYHRLTSLVGECRFSDLICVGDFRSSLSVCFACRIFRNKNRFNTFSSVEFIENDLSTCDSFFNCIIIALIESNLRVK